LGADGWQISESLRSDLAIDALAMAAWKPHPSRPGPRRLDLSQRPRGAISLHPKLRAPRRERHRRLGWITRDGQGHSGSFNSLYKCKRNNPQCPWSGLDDVEFASLGFIDWFDRRRFQCGITQDNSYATPEEFEATYYRQMQPTADAATH
jgi:putative transposase